MPKPRKHKRKAPKSSRAGCQLCKPHKRNGCEEQTKSEKVRIASAESTREKN